MRYINTSCIHVPANWLQIASKDDTISPNFLWSYFRASFESSFGKKCWYSESENIGAVNPIDHFRPKATTVKALPESYRGLIGQAAWIQLDCNQRTGYSFLTHEFSNYRYTCSIVNSPNKKDTKDGITRGKLNYFPLKANSIHGTDLASVSNEQICLLDPCNPEDPLLVSFNSLGAAIANNTLLTDSWNYVRVKVSIEIYHLNYFAFVDKRKEIWLTCENWIQFADILYSKKNKTNEDFRLLAGYLKHLKKSISIKEQFSAVAIDCIVYHKQTINWLATYFPSIELTK